MTRRHAAKSIRLSHSAIVKAPGLLPMRYTLRELAEELSIPVKTLNDWRDLGLPCDRDERGHVWICGTEFAAWIEGIRQQQRRKLKPHEAYCVACRRVVAAVETRIEHLPRLSRLKGACPQCGHTVIRILRRSSRWSTDPTTTSPGNS